MNQLALDLKPLEPSYRLIKLTKGFFAKVSLEKYEELNRYKWTARKSPDGKYVATRSARISDGRIRGGPSYSILMSRQIMNAPKGVFVDHINRDSIDNRTENLRLATPAQNKFNCKKRSDSKWPYKGIAQPKGKSWWVANIQSHGANIFLGCFKTAEDARDAYIEAAKKIHGEFACSDISDSSIEKTVHDDLATSGARALHGSKHQRRIKRTVVVQPDDLSLRYIGLPRGEIVIVDVEEFDKFSHYAWNVLINRQWGTKYALRSSYENGKTGNIWLHKEVLGVGRGVIVDHINGNTLDCRKCNLRIATVEENASNHRIRKDNVSGFKGVHEYKPTGWTPTKRWKAQIAHNGKAVPLGYFLTPEEAHAAYKRAANILHGEFANY